MIIYILKGCGGYYEDYYEYNLYATNDIYKCKEVKKKCEKEYKKYRKLYDKINEDFANLELRDYVLLQTQYDEIAKHITIDSRVIEEDDVTSYKIEELEAEIFDEDNK